MSVVPACHAEPLLRNDSAMRYRPFGRTGWEVSALSMGCMRLGDDESVNAALLGRALDLGVNYFESTRYYLGGTCQHRTAPGLKGRTTGVIVSGKDGIGPDKTAAEFRREMERQLDILGLTHFKFYQVGWFSWEMMPHLLKPGGVLDALRRAKEEGLVQRVGFTGHDTPENFIKCIETGLFDSITVPYNLINRAYEPTIRRAGELGVGVVAMCPVAGGVLAGESERLKAALRLDLPTTEMALRFVLSNPHVSTACSGMNEIGQLEENARTALAFDPAGAPFEAMCEGLDRLRSELGDHFCTACRYCMPCPQGIDLPHYMTLDREARVYGLVEQQARRLAHIPAEHRADACSDCGACEARCPNGLPIRETIRRVERAAAESAG